MPKIEIDNLSVTYLDRKHKEYPVLKNVSGCFESESINVITGASGTGKTTLLRAIASQFDYDGTIRFDGVDTSNLSKADRGSVAYIDQKTFLFENKIVYDILAFPLKQQHKKVDEIDKEVKKMAVLLAISNLLTRKPKQLSPGQRQKVAFGKALIKNPKVCLFDEPFSNLDEESRKFFLQFLRRVVQEKDMTVLFASHSDKDADLLGAAVYSLSEEGLKKIRDADEESIHYENFEQIVSEDCEGLSVNRKQLFKDILKNRYHILLLIGMMLCLFALPIIGVSIFNDLSLLSFFADASNYVDGVMTESGATLYRSIILNFTLFFDVGFLILGIGLAGVARVIRQLCWGEGIHFFDSFGKGLKQNILRFIVLTIIFDIMFTAIRLLFLVVDVLWAAVLVSAVSVLALLPFVLVCFGYSAIYSNHLPKAFANSALLAVKHYPISLLFSIVCIIPFFIEFIPYGLSIVKTVLLIVFMVLLLPILILTKGLMLNSVFDKEINADKHKEIYRKGLY